MNLRYIDWIWHVRGNLPLEPGQTGDEALERLVPLLQEPGTSHERTGDTLIFHKKDPVAQDKMSVFENGTLQIEQGESGPVLRYHLISRALLFCFLMPLLFLCFAQLTIVIGKYQKPPAEAASASDKAKKAKDAVIPLNPIDKALGAPAPEKPKKDADKPGKKKPSPTPAYVFAAIFAALYVGGRILEARLVRKLFQKRLMGS